MNKMTQRSLAAASALALGVGFAMFGASAAQAGVSSHYTFKVDTLATTGGVAVDASADIDDDGGYVAVTKNAVLLNGDAATFAYNLSTLAGIGATDVGSTDLVIFTDLGTETAYSMTVVEDANGDDTLGSATALDADGDLTSTVVTFSETINVGQNDEFTLASGAGQIGIWNNITGELYLVTLPSGVVHKTTVSTLADFTGVAPEVGNGESDAMNANGVLEYDCTNYSIVMLDTDANYSRFGLTGATQETLADSGIAPGDYDNDNIVVSPTANRWYSHSESDGNTTAFGININGMDEPFISADATMTTTPNVCADALPDTGVDATQGGLLAVGAGAAALAGVLFVVIRRRASQA